MTDDKKNFIDLPAWREKALTTWKMASDLALSSVSLPRAFTPLMRVLVSAEPLSQEVLTQELDSLFDSLYRHPLSEHSRAFTAYLRRTNVIPNEESTENLIRFVIKQTIQRSPVDIPEVVVDEFWQFFQELIESPEMKGLLELNLDLVRAVLRSYEPLLVDIVNRIKSLRKVNQTTFGDIMQKLRVLRGDILILKRQIRAIRYIKPYFQTNPKDFKTQAEIVARMVGEFGPLFIKMAQVAAANADFLPEEIARELQVFQEDVEPMTPQEVRQAFIEEFGDGPQAFYFGFDIEQPIKSGSIGSVYFAKKPVRRGDKEELVPVVVKVARHNLEREFAMGNLAIELMLISSQYWAPHSKLKPFLNAMSLQIKEFTRGFEQELDFLHEANIQQRFHERAEHSQVWSVPRLYGASGRIIEMEYIHGAKTISQAIQAVEPIRRRRFQRQLAENFLFTMLEHLLVYQEFHGDLHPGNVMIDAEGRLYLIDWGNTVDMRGKWSLIARYLRSVLIGDIDALAQVLVAMSTNPQANQTSLSQIRAGLQETLEKKQLQPLGRDFALVLFREGREGFKRRFQTAMHLMSNTYQLGITIKSDYLHLSRSLFAMAGTYNALYKGISGWTMAGDALVNVGLFPFRYAWQRATSFQMIPEQKPVPLIEPELKRIA
jgi:predicted unusual protein kinase regulating ubiquinone biosynthesis (AarF/ABC1/UbiB family)